jgi:signal transduction histidine kinase
VAVATSAVFAAGILLQASDVLFSNICLYLAMYSVGAWSRRRRLATWVRLAIVAGMFIWLFTHLIVQANQITVLPELSRAGVFSPYAAHGLLQVFINLVYFGAAWYFGESAWKFARNAAALRSSTTQLAAERERTAAQAITLERVRIARELHDVVAHHVSVMGVQAGAARRILSRDPGQAMDALTIIEQSARSAVDELHIMLGALRGDDGPGNKPTNQSSSTRGLAQLGELANESRTAGVPVRLSIVGEERAISATIGLSIYRIAQEALTNTRKHAGPGASTDLRLRYEADAVEVEITDDGVGPRRQFAAALQGGPSAETTGLGQRGMHERVAAVGGELHLGGRPRGGYLVRARFPVMAREQP